MYLNIRSEDLKKYNLPSSNEQLFQRIRHQFQLVYLTRQCLKQAYSNKMRLLCNQQKKRIEISNLYYLYGCIANNNHAQILVLVVINNDFIRLDSILSKTQLTKTKQIVNKKYHNFSLIYFSARTGLRKPMRVLIKHGSLFKIEGDISSPIHAASYYGQKNILKLLIDLGSPTDLKNRFGNTPKEETTDQTIIKLLQNAYNNKIDELNFRLSRQGKSNGKIRIYYKGELVGQKIILNNYEYKSFNRIKTFHGTRYQVLESIVKNGMKMPGDEINGRILGVVEGHYLQAMTHQGVKNFAIGIFSSPSIIYAGCPAYAKTFQIQVEGEKQQWDPIVQLRIKKNLYDMFTSTVDQHYKAKGQPLKIQARISKKQRQIYCEGVKKGIITTQSKQIAQVQALIFVKSGFLRRELDREGIVQQMNRLFMESEEQQFFLLKKQK